MAPRRPKARVQPEPFIIALGRSEYTAMSKGGFDVARVVYGSNVLHEFLISDEVKQRPAVGSVVDGRFVIEDPAQGLMLVDSMGNRQTWFDYSKGLRRS